MSQGKELHLDDDQILWAVVDESELTSSLREHLSSCSQCLARKGRLEKHLERLGQSAFRFVPALGKKATLFYDRPNRSQQWFWTWKGALAAAIAAVAIAVAFWAVPRIITLQQNRMAKLTQEILTDEQLMTEISQLEENALPPVYVDLSGETNLLFDKEFMDFVVPSVENEVRSQNLIMGGVA